MPLAIGRTIAAVCIKYLRIKHEGTSLGILSYIVSPFYKSVAFFGNARGGGGEGLLFPRVFAKPALMFILTTRDDKLLSHYDTRVKGSCIKEHFNP